MPKKYCNTLNCYYYQTTHTIEEQSPPAVPVEILFIPPPVSMGVDPIRVVEATITSTPLKHSKESLPRPSAIEVIDKPIIVEKAPGMDTVECGDSSEDQDLDLATTTTTTTTTTSADAPSSSSSPRSLSLSDSSFNNRGRKRKIDEEANNNMKQLQEKRRKKTRTKVIKLQQELTEKSETIKGLEERLEEGNRKFEEQGERLSKLEAVVADYEKTHSEFGSTWCSLM